MPYESSPIARNGMHLHGCVCGAGDARHHGGSLIASHGVPLVGRRYCARRGCGSWAGDELATESRSSDSGAGSARDEWHVDGDVLPVVGSFGHRRLDDRLDHLASTQSASTPVPADSDFPKSALRGSASTSAVDRVMCGALLRRSVHPSFRASTYSQHSLWRSVRQCEANYFLARSSSVPRCSARPVAAPHVRERRPPTQAQQ